MHKIVVNDLTFLLSVVQALQSISEEYAVAFGSFGDKRAIPYAISSDNINAYRRGSPRPEYVHVVYSLEMRTSMNVHVTLC